MFVSSGSSAPRLARLFHDLLDELLEAQVGLARVPGDHRPRTRGASLAEERAVEPVGALGLRDALTARRQEAPPPAAAEVLARLVPAVALLLVRCAETAP